MYLISAYFDNNTNKRIQSFINRIAEKTGNSFMTENNVPPHMTISSVEARDVELLVPHISELRDKLHRGKVQLVSVGMLLPYVMYITPVLNEFLLDLSKQVYDVIPKNPEVTVSKYYKPMQWLPHVTLAKKLSKEQMQTAFSIMQESFAPIEGEIISIGLAKTNPHVDVLKFDLK